MPEIRYYVASDGQQSFATWFANLEAVARAKVARAIVRLEQGNFSNAKSVGAGVFEYRIDFGPGRTPRAIAFISGKMVRL